MRAQGVHLHHTLQSGHQHGGELGHPLFELLAAVQASGSIQRAAASLGGSYRHAWASLKRWESGLGRPLVVWTQGHPARLTRDMRGLVRRVRGDPFCAGRSPPGGGEWAALRGVKHGTFGAAGRGTSRPGAAPWQGMARPRGRGGRR